MAVQQFFLGANSAHGFYSLYDGFCPADRGEFLWILKGGPGCGKSSFMKRIGLAAEKQGFDVEYVLCSGDPASVDGVKIPALGVGYADGTAPHVLEPSCPAVSGGYIDLGQFYDLSALRDSAERITALTRAYKACYREAYRILSVASGAAEGLRCAPKEPHLTFLTVKNTPGRRTRRFLRAITCKGLIELEHTNGRMVGSFSELDALAENALQAGLDVIVHPHPLLPELTEGLTIDGEHFYADCAAADELFREAVKGAVVSLRQAKTFHDELEAAYNPHVDFEGVYTLAEQHIQRLLS